MRLMTFQRAAARRLRRLIPDTGGATAIEYALIIFIVTLAIGFLLSAMGASIQGIFDGISSKISAGVAAGQSE